MMLNGLVEPVISVIELVGFSVIVFGMVVAAVWAAYKQLTTDNSWDDSYVTLRRMNGRALVLGLELLVAAEIIRSITAETLEAVMMLAAVVIVRTFIAITVEMETEGRWPWKRHEAKSRSRGQKSGDGE